MYVNFFADTLRRHLSRLLLMDSATASPGVGIDSTIIVRAGDCSSKDPSGVSYSQIDERILEMV